MATFTSTFLTMMLLLAASNAAPNQKLSPLKIPDECKGKGFCSIKPEGYDDMKELINSLLTPKFIAQSIGDRIGDDTIQNEELSPKEDWHNCPYRKKIENTVFAYSHSNLSEPDYIIQNELLRQSVEIVTCAPELISPKDTNSSEECFQHLDLKSFNMKSSCQSSTAKRSLLVLDYKTKQLVKKSYDVPCCCTCHIVRANL